MTYSLMIVQQGALPTLLEFPTHKAAEIAARELRVKSDSLQIINNTSGKVTNFSAVLEAEARAEEELSAAMHWARIDSLPEGEIRRIYAQYKKEHDEWEERRQRHGVRWGGSPPHLDRAVACRMGDITKHDKLERQWVEAMEELCGVSRKPDNAHDQAPASNVPREVDMSRAADNSLALFCVWGGLMLAIVAAVHAVG